MLPYHPNPLPSLLPPRRGPRRSLHPAAAGIGLLSVRAAVPGRPVATRPRASLRLRGVRVTLQLLGDLEFSEAD
eukprot:749891-Hanusia_phi.AAC.1